MATPRLDITIRSSSSIIDRLNNHRNDCRLLESRYQYFISEMIMLRLFAVFEDTVAEIAYKIGAGAQYINGTIPNLLYRSNSMAGARTEMLRRGRSKPIQNLRWTKARYIRESVQHVIDVNEKYVQYAIIYGNEIDEMRKVRNFLAHRNTSTRREFRDVIRLIYGANLNISSGAFLVSDRRLSPTNLDRYIATTKIVLNDMVKGF